MSNKELGDVPTSFISDTPEPLAPAPAPVRWAECPGDARLEVSSAGEVRHRSSGRYLALHCNEKGYVYVAIRVDGRPKSVRLNRLVLAAFVGPRPSTVQAAHLDGSRDNNHLCNLEWQTPQRNAVERHVHGTQVQGEQIQTAKLTAESVAAIRARMASGDCDLAIASDFGICRQTANKVRTGQTWKHVAIPAGSSNPAGRRRSVDVKPQSAAALAGKAVMP